MRIVAKKVEQPVYDVTFEHVTPREAELLYQIGNWSEPLASTFVAQANQISNLEFTQVEVESLLEQLYYSLGAAHQDYRSAVAQNLINKKKG